MYWTGKETDKRWTTRFGTWEEISVSGFGTNCDNVKEISLKALGSGVPVMVNMVLRRESRMEWSMDVEVMGIRGEEKVVIAVLGMENQVEMIHGGYREVGFGS